MHKSRGEIKKKKRDFQRQGLDCKTSELQGANWRWPFRPKTTSFKSTIHSPLPLKSRKICARNSPKQYQPYPIPSPKPSQIIGWIVYHKSHSWFSSFCPHDAPLALRKPITSSPTMAWLLVFSSYQTWSKFKIVIIFIHDHHPKKIRLEFLS